MGSEPERSSVPSFRCHVEGKQKSSLAVGILHLKPQEDGQRCSCRGTAWQSAPNIHFGKAPAAVVLACTVAGNMLPPTYNNLQRKKGAEAVMTTRLCGHSTKERMDGWRAHDHMAEEDCFAIHEEGHDPSSTRQLVHTDVPFALLASENNINLAVIPGGSTQRVCKQAIQRCGTPPVITNHVEATKSGNLKAASKVRVVAWMKKAWRI